MQDGLGHQPCGLLGLVERHIRTTPAVQCAIRCFNGTVTSPHGFLTSPAEHELKKKPCLALLSTPSPDITAPCPQVPIIPCPTYPFLPCAYKVLNSNDQATALTTHQGFVKAYSRILALGANPDHAYKPFPTILDHLSSVRPPAPILIHCTAGKDRTGVICALILSLCGVSDEAVAHEYSLTDIGLQPRRDEIVDQLLASDALKGNRAGAESMISSRYFNCFPLISFCLLLFQTWIPCRDHVGGPKLLQNVA